MGVDAEIIALLRDVLEEEPARLEPDTSLIAEGLLDSLGILDLIELLEERYGVRFAEEEIVPDNFENVCLIAALLERKRAERRG